ncbi:MAG: hypothetical protein LBJ36_05745 [Synergistaceae bacterium]|jgi:hypothetical protein|nr:hypothetical protein [Synergistaceae bacterium]
MNIEIVRLRPEHARITPYLRSADTQEIVEGSGISPSLAVAFSIAHSSPGYAALLDGELVVVFGASPAGAPGVGVVWLLATQEIERHPVRFYRESKRMFGNVAEKYETLINWVDQRNTLSLRWLKWLGFEIGEPEPWGVMGLPFCRVRKMRRKNDGERTPRIR